MWSQDGLRIRELSASSEVWRFGAAQITPGLWPHHYLTCRFVVSHPFASKKAKGWGTEKSATSSGQRRSCQLTQ
jgi:hypothetical protein